MLSLENQSLPLASREIELVLSDEIVKSFQKAFLWKSHSIPPTFAARAFTGMFELLDQLQVNWQRLLHTAQSFEYLEKLEIDQKLLAQSFLVRARKRGQTYFLTFDSVMKNAEGQEVLRAQSSILVEDL